MTDRAARGLTTSQERIIDYLNDLGGAARTVELAPSVMLRKAGVLATQEAIGRVHADLHALQTAGHVLLGEPTSTGVMVILRTATDLPVLITCERLVTMYGWLNDHERAALSRWETNCLALGGPSTTDWPGWPTIYRRRYS